MYDSSPALYMCDSSPALYMCDSSPALCLGSPGLALSTTTAPINRVAVQGRPPASRRQAPGPASLHVTSPASRSQWREGSTPRDSRAVDSDSSEDSGEGDEVEGDKEGVPGGCARVECARVEEVGRLAG